MHKISWKETAFLVAPIGIIGAMMWWLTPPNPQILECKLRPATPVEISQGADFGLTARTSAPANPFPCGGMDVSLSPTPNGKHLMGLWYDARAKTIKRFKNDLYEWQTNNAYKRTEKYNDKDSLIAEVELRTGCGTVNRVQKQYLLSTKDIPLPNIKEARQTNFRVTNSILINMTKKMCQLELQIADAQDLSQALSNQPKCIGKWSWQYGQKKYSIPASIGLWSLSDDHKVTKACIDFTKTKSPLRKGALIVGQLSIQGGWPQIVTLELQEDLPATWTSTDKLKVTTQLAPLSAN